MKEGEEREGGKVMRFYSIGERVNLLWDCVNL